VQYPIAYCPGTPEVNLAFSWSEMTREKMYLLTYIGNLLYILRIFPNRYSPESDLAVFLDNNGMIGFAPKNILLGDAIL
jgi:hypothetical protein